MAQLAATEGAAHQGPTRLQLKFEEAPSGSLGAGNHELGPGTGLGGQREQQGVVAGTAHHQAIAGGQIGASDPQREAIGVDVAAADSREIKAGQERLYQRRLASCDAETGPFGAELLVDVELGPIAFAADRRRHQHEALHVEGGSLEQRLGSAGAGAGDRHSGAGHGAAGPAAQISRTEHRHRQGVREVERMLFRPPRAHQRPARHDDRLSLRSGWDGEAALSSQCAALPSARPSDQVQALVLPSLAQRSPCSRRWRLRGGASPKRPPRPRSLSHGRLHSSLTEHRPHG